ncbi:thioredoxin family protein [Larkinella punicea]|uniref:Thioredoxin family protein n=1 Tax=Larkinella punicea TaxID=2315727 RepID=A0A368JVB0_9BACT|nr:thioredoxin family protein [Larkinella punicea]RCR70876.1 thioredoxin family protein [Larkinella punicea]
MNLFRVRNIIHKNKRLVFLLCFSLLWMVFPGFGQEVTLKEAIQKEHESLKVETGSYAEMVAYSGGAIKPISLSMLPTLTDSSKAKDKPIILYFFADWDLYSHKMRKETFRYKNVSGLVNQEFYFVALNEKTDVAKKLYKTITGTELKSFPMTVYLNPKKNYSFQYPGYQTDLIYISNLFKIKKVGYTKIDNRILNNLGKLFKKDFKLAYTMFDELEAFKQLSAVEEISKNAKSLSEIEEAIDDALYTLKDEESFDRFLKHAGFVKFASTLSYDQKDSLRTDEYVSLDTVSRSVLTAAVVFRNLRHSLNITPGSKQDKNIQTYMAKHLIMVGIPTSIRKTIEEYCKKNMTLTESKENKEMYYQAVREKLSIDSEKGLIYKAGFSILLTKDNVLIQYN